MQVEYLRHLNKTTQPYPGIVELLSKMRQRGMRLAVLSNKPDEFTAQCVTEFFGDAAFEPILGLRANRPRKPDPALITAHVLPKFAILQSRDILMVGDTELDIHFAKASGMACCWAAYGFGDAERCRALQPEHEIAGIEDLPAVVAGAA